ncbi:MAG: carboxy terminal-processing peptidase [Flavobacteriales bacterium]|nr:carboxy terminal-processing peptidase [Flavobacteriales bacterium]
MNKILKLTIILSLVVGIGAAYGFYKRKPDKDRVLLELIQYVLEEGHYSPSELDNEFSMRFYDDYIKNLDYSKRYFLQSDIHEFEPFNTLIDDQLKFGDLTFFDLTFQRVSKRIEEVKTIYTEILSKPMDFSKKEFLESNVDSLSFAKDRSELEDRWRLYLKYNVLVRISDAQDTQEKELKDDPNFEVKSFEVLEKEARAAVQKTFDGWNERLTDLDRDDWFSVYLNVLTAQFDPHTTYFAPRDKDRFDQDISGHLEGIGARLQAKDGFVTVIEVIGGSPSWKQGDLEVEDKILKVAQDKDEPVSIVGMRLDDAVDLIKGKKGTKVRLFVKKLDGSKKEIPITRDVVEIEETFAKSSIIDRNGTKFGIIHLPKFYIDFKDRDARNAGDDVEKEVKYLKNEGVKGIILDLRNNGGGSLQTAVKMSGLFINEGPIVQVKSRDKAPQILKDENADILWDGPLVVLVNEYSASASEILAAALKDYGRAVIVGSKHTYGKGTVQNIWDLDKLINPRLEVKPLGSLKLTIQKFYRINGGATQLKGVESDIALPDRLSYLDIGEKQQENPMPWDTISPLKYKKWHLNRDLDDIKSKSSKRVSKSEQFKLIDENAIWLKNRRENERVALDIEGFKKENDEFEKEVSKFKPLSKYDNKLTFESLPNELKLIEQDSVFAMKRERWHKALKKDAYVEEAVNILNDLK